MSRRVVSCSVVVSCCSHITPHPTPCTCSDLKRRLQEAEARAQAASNAAQRFEQAANHLQTKYGAVDVAVYNSLMADHDTLQQQLEAARAEVAALAEQGRQAAADAEARVRAAEAAADGKAQQAGAGLRQQLQSLQVHEGLVGVCGLMMVLSEEV